MRNVWIIMMIAMVPVFGQADEKNCTVKGMHCDACTEMVQDKVCNDQYEVCTVTLKNKKGFIHLKTKDATAKIDEKMLSQAMADTTYKVEKCTATKAN